MNRKKDKYRLLIENLPDAFACHRIVTGNKGEPVDYIFLDINAAFEDMTGLKRDEVIGEKVTAVLPGIEMVEFDWIGIYGQVALSSEPVRFESFSEPIGRWYEVCAYSDESGYFATIFKDVTAQKKTETALSESENKFRCLFEFSTDGHILFDGKKYIDCNDACLKMLGLKNKNELLSLHPKDISPEYQPDGRLSTEKAREMINIARENGTHLFDWVCTCTDGSSLFLEAQLNCITLEGKEIIHSVWRDISKRKETEKALRESEEKLSGILNNLEDGVWSITYPGEEILYLSPSLEKIYGRTLEELYYNPRCWQDAVHPDDKHLIENAYDQIIDEGKADRECRIIRPDGKVAWLRDRSKLIYDEDNNPVRLEGIVADITERKQTEETMRLNSIVLNQIKDLVTITNLEGDILYVNQAEIELLKLPREKLIGANTDIFGENPEKGATQKEIREMTIRNGTWRGEVINYSLDGKELIFDCRTQVIYDEQGKPIALCGISTDITKRKKAEAEIRTLNEELEQRVRERTAQLEAANRELDAFTYSASHDLRGPLNRITGFSEALLEDYLDQLDQQGRHCLQRINNSCEHMKLLIDDLLKLSRVSQHQINCEPVELSALVNVCLKELQAREPQRQVETAVAPDLVAEGDTALLRIALENLLGNAWKFTAGEEKARIEFGSTVYEGKEVFYIRDNGAGFDMQYAEKLFAQFQRLHDSKTYPGIGIGLSIVSRIIDRHGGEVWAEGEEGRGACFYFTLP